MGLNTIGAAGVALPPPQALYPPTVGVPFSQPQVSATNRLSLGPGGAINIPSGTWWINIGQYSILQALDPVTNYWVPFSTSGSLEGNPTVNSDGFNYRAYNPLGFVQSVLVNNGGTGFTSAPTVTAGNGAGTTFQAIVGGAVSAINISTGGSGLNYGIPPIVNIAAPPTPGVQATAVATLSGTLITGFTIVNPGAGYTSAPAVTIIPNPFDPNVQATSTVNVTNAKATAQLSYVGVVTAVLVTNQGGQLQNSPPVLTFAGGGGSGATATAIPALTVTNVTYTTPGSGYVAVGTPAALGIGSFGGTVTSAAAASNSSAMSTGFFIPRQVQIVASVSSGGVSPAGWVPSNGVIDGGVFQQAPNLYAYPGPAGASTAVANLTPVMGTVNDTVFITPQ